MKIFKNEVAERFYNEYLKLDEFKKMTVRYILKRKQRHKFHIVAPSPWPIYSSSSAFMFVMGMIFWMHFSEGVVLVFGLVTIMCSFYFWFKDIIREGLYMGYHTQVVERSLRLGFMLFLVSEVMFFFGFFWALLHFSLTGDPASGNIWPPEGIVHHLYSENLNITYNQLSLHRDSFFNLLSLYQNDSIFTNLFSQKKHILDYQLNTSTFVSFPYLDTFVRYVFGDKYHYVVTRGPLERGVFFTTLHGPAIPIYFYPSVCYFYPYYVLLHSCLAEAELGVWKLLNSLTLPAIKWVDYGVSHAQFILTTKDRLEPLGLPALQKGGGDLPSDKLFYYFNWVRSRKIPFSENNRNPILRVTSFSSGLLINPYKIPLLNTALLLTSGALLTLSHLFLRLEIFKWSKIFIILTIIFGIYFFYFQACEYLETGFSINDGIYGSLFFVLTGLHGVHVIIGTLFLIVCCIRLFYSHFTSGNHFAFEAAAWYWHFVDVVWILLFLLVYLWPSARYFGGHRVEIALIKFGEFYQPAIFYNINIKETLHYKYYVKEQLPHYNSIFYGSSKLPLNKFISKQHWSADSEIHTPQMGLYFTKILFKRIGEAAKNTFFFEVLYTTFEKVESRLVSYFYENFNWKYSKRLTYYVPISEGGLEVEDCRSQDSFSLAHFSRILSQIKTFSSILPTDDWGATVKLHLKKNLMSWVHPMYRTTHVNRPFSFDGIHRFNLTLVGHYYFPQEEPHIDSICFGGECE